MNKKYQEEELRKLLINSTLKSGLYLIDTVLNDEELESFLKGTNLYSYEKEILFQPPKGSIFEFFVIGLSHRCHNKEISKQINWLLHTKDKENVLYNLVLLIMQELCSNKKTILHVQGELDFTSFSEEELSEIQASIVHHSIIMLSIKKNKSRVTCSSTINKISFKQIDKYKLMESKLEKVHISYKHDAEYEAAIEAIKKGLDTNDIPFSIDEYDIMYRDDIKEYEKEIGAANRVIMFVIPSYLKSIDCMYEMTQMFKNGNIKERIYPVVDMGTISRDGDGLKPIQEYWQKEYERKVNQATKEPGNSAFVLKEVKIINDILNSIDEFWSFVVYIYSENYEELIKNNAALLIEALKNTLPKETANIDSNFVPTRGFTPTGGRNVTQNGEKSISIENNSGNIFIN